MITEVIQSHKRQAKPSLTQVTLSHFKMSTLISVPFHFLTRKLSFEGLIENKCRTQSCIIMTSLYLSKLRYGLDETQKYKQ